ncbi:unnamed protein product [Rotaria sordida]|uniref:PDZ domain-containing protein n=1 Tax=Rotaria sordida TaxID=392033 RepID=A0A814BZN9_9BILA|nr:unnamed protein product [Rotaria sordida]
MATRSQTPTRSNKSPTKITHKKSQVHAEPLQNQSQVIPLVQSGTAQRTSLIEHHNISDAKKSIRTENGFEYQLIPVEIQKEAEIGLVIGHIEGEPWVFIDEILPNGMIDMHGILTEGDYLIQAGIYSLADIDIKKALLLIERAYDEGRNSLSFIAARQQKPNVKSLQVNQSQDKKKPFEKVDRRESRARSFVEYENEEEEEPEPEAGDSNENDDQNTTKF